MFCPLVFLVLLGQGFQEVPRIVVRFILAQAKSLLEPLAFNLGFIGWLDCTGTDFSGPLRIL